MKIRIYAAPAVKGLRVKLRHISTQRKIRNNNLVVTMLNW